MIYKDLREKWEQNKTLDAKAFSEAHGLDFSLRSERIRTVEGTEFEGNKLLVNSRTGIPVSVVSDRYRVFQASDMVSFADSVRNEFGGWFSDSGVWDRGRRVRISLGLGGLQSEPQKGDIVCYGLNIENSNDGSSAVRISLNAMRLVCMNGSTFSENQSTYRIHHTSLLSRGLNSAREGIEKTLGFIPKFSEKMKIMAETVIDTETVSRLVQSVFPKPENPDRKDGFWRQRNAVYSRYRQGLGSELFNGRNTVWRAYNAITEQLTHGVKADTQAVENRRKLAWAQAVALIQS